jgi:acetyl-CoA acyltransferase
MSQQGREVVIVEAVRTPVGRGHPEKGYFRDIHPNELLGTCYLEVIARAWGALRRYVVKLCPGRTSPKARRISMRSPSVRSS